MKWKLKSACLRLENACGVSASIMSQGRGKTHIEIGQYLVAWPYGPDTLCRREVQAWKWDASIWAQPTSAYWIKIYSIMWMKGLRRFLEIVPGIQFCLRYADLWPCFGRLVNMKGWIVLRAGAEECNVGRSPRLEGKQRDGLRRGQFWPVWPKINLKTGSCTIVCGCVHEYVSECIRVCVCMCVCVRRCANVYGIE